MKAVDADEGGYAAKLNDQVNADEVLMDDMEQKRRDEEAFKMQQERIQRKLQGENAQITANDNN